jgi:hypothetical protein
MRGEETFDGKISGNRQLVDRYNEAKGKKPAKGQKKPKQEGGESGGERSVGGHDEQIRQVVSEHGPAKSSHIIDRGEGHPDGRFHVMTHHEDGHIHHADHEDLGAVHDHLAAAHEGDSEHFGDMTPDDEGVASEHASMENIGSGSRGSRRVGAMG